MSIIMSARICNDVMIIINMIATTLHYILFTILLCIVSKITDMITRLLALADLTPDLPDACHRWRRRVGIPIHNHHVAMIVAERNPSQSMILAVIRVITICIRDIRAHDPSANAPLNCHRRIITTRVPPYEPWRW